MKEKKYSFNFHSTFFPDLENISRLLEICDNNVFLSKEEIFNLTGIPTGKSTGKVAPHINYASYMNLIEYEKVKDEYLLKKTKLGELIFNVDPYFQEDISKYLCHYFLTSSTIGADMWYEIFRNFPTYLGNETSGGVVKDEVSRKFNLKSAPKLTPFIGTYLKDNSLGSLNLLQIGEENKYIFNSTDYDNNFIYVYAYTLIADLEYIYDSRREFTVDEIFDCIKWNRAFNWDKDKASEVLDIIAERGILKMNKQLIPVTVILNFKSKEILDKLYSMLI